MVSSVVLIIFWAIILVLNIILFFKIWGMTNNVSKIKDILLHALVSNNTHEILKNTPQLDASELLTNDKLKENNEDEITGYIIISIFGLFFVILFVGFLIA